ncbi:uncharacterized protein LOC105392188 isoform X2 [Plutella xylostella]|uniref:uncharacterized protein LOC105392188 isoform X2 n=1 Tax=Plutella xylostella TaxID=51655 RepID=UPI002032CA4F|nr:uncharacterized protein LOC105392188 isoform X2 [Plutella xylostella]
MSSLMSDEVKDKTKQDGDNVAKDETKTDTESKEVQAKEPKSVSFNRDVHVKRFGKPRESRSASSEYQPPIRKEPFNHLSEQELIEEANKVLAQADSVTCTADHPPEKFFSLPHRRKLKEQPDRRNSDDAAIPDKQPLGRSTSDVSQKRRKERTSLSTLFRKAQRTKSPEKPVVVNTKPVVIVKRSKSDVSDLKSNTSLNTQPKPIRKRAGSETEEFLKSLRNKKTQLSPIIESSPREDYFRKTPPLESFLKKNQNSKPDTSKSENNNKDIKINPVEKPPRYKSPDKEPKPPARSKRSKSSDKELSPPITETPKRKTEVKKTLLVDEIDTVRSKDNHSVEVKDRIKDSIKKIEENIYGSKDMIHSSQQPPDKPPLTRGQTVDQIVRILKEDQLGPPPKSHLIAAQSGTSTNQPFSYTKPSLSPDPNLFVRNTSPDRVPTPVNKMNDKGVVYAQVVRDKENGTSNLGKQTVHKTYSPSRERFCNMSDEDEGLGYEDRYKISPDPKNNSKYNSHQDKNYNIIGDYKVTDSPIKPRFREYKLTSFEDFEPTYANEFPTKEQYSRDFVDSAIRGRGDGIDYNKRKQSLEPEPKIDLDFNELSHRRQLLESRINARRLERDRVHTEEPAIRYIMEKDPIYEAQKRMKATEKYVNETARYYRHTLEKDGYAENKVSEDYNKYDSDNNKIKYNTESRTFNKVPKDELDRREFIEGIPTDRFKDEPAMFPPEPEYEPPSLEIVNSNKPITSPIEYTEKKYKVKTKHVTSSHDVIETGQKYKKDDWFSKKKGHYASNPEINQERDDDYANTRDDPETYHNSLKREKNRDKYLKENYGIQRHDSGDSRDYYRDERSPRRFDVDNRLVDSGIENDFRKDSGELNRSRYLKNDSDDDMRHTSLLLESERQHTEDNYHSEQLYANGEYITRFESTMEYPRKEYSSRERSSDEGARFSSRNGRYDKSPSRHDDKVSAKPPKANGKKLTGLEKMKQLFSRDSSKKSSKLEKEVQRTRVLKSPEQSESGYRRYRDPEPSDDDRRRSDREDGDRYRSPDAHTVNRYRADRHRTQHRVERRRYGSSDRDSERSPRPSDQDSDLKVTRVVRAKTADPLDSPALAAKYRGRRRLATPSPPPSPPPLAAPPPAPSNWFKSLDRLTRKRNKSSKVTKDTEAHTEDESSRKPWSKPTKPLNSPAKNLRFFGDTDQDSDTYTKQQVSKSRSHPSGRSHTLLRKTTSNSSTGLDEVDRSVLSNKSSSLSNLHREDKDRRQYHKRNLHNISEIHSNSENESHIGRRVELKPPISPYERSSRSHSSSKTLKGSKQDVRRPGSRERVLEDRGSSSELRSSKQELSRDATHRRRTPANLSGESSTEGDSSHQSQRSVVYLHATTVGDIPDPGRLGKNRSRDDVSSVNSSNMQIRTTQKTFSIFAPWTPKHYGDQHDVHYAQKPRKPKEKEPIKKYSSNKNLADDRESTLQKKKSYSQTTLNRRPPSSRLTNSSTTLNRKPERRTESVQSTTLSRTKNKKSQSNEILNRENERERLSRSISMPKDKNKKAGWFNLSNKNKKPELNTRVR